MILLVDIGNSRIKWSIIRDQQPSEYFAAFYSSTNLLQWCEQNWGAYAAPDKVLISNVGGHAIADVIDAWCRENWQIEPHYAKVVRQQYGLKNGYEDIKQFGVDRWCAMVAAWSRYQSAVCVIDCGTAITIDCINQDGLHLGGLIIPGIEMMEQSLNQQTHGVRSEPVKNANLWLGRSTEHGVSNGIRLAIISLIDRVVEGFQSSLDQPPHIIITGGSGEAVRGQLGWGTDFDPNLVLTGLEIMVRES